MLKLWVDFQLQVMHNDFFVIRFASMSHSNERELRMAGLNELKGVIRKTVIDDLHGQNCSLSIVQHATSG